MFKGSVEECVVLGQENSYSNKTKFSKVAAVSIEVKTGKKWNKSSELIIAEEHLTQKNLLVTVVSGHSGLDFF